MKLVRFWVEYAQESMRLKALFDAGTQRSIRGTLRPYGIEAMRAAEGFDDEDDFCERALAPLVEQWGYDYEREFHIQRRIGSRRQNMYVDFLLLDENTGRNLGILEAKRTIRNDRELDDAAAQALSYVLFMGLDPVLVAAPQGLWCYQRRGQNIELHASFSVEEAFARRVEIRQLIDSMISSPTSHAL